MTNLLVVDVGTTGLRAALVDEELRVRRFEYRPNPPSTPAPGLVEFDAQRMAELVLDATHAVLEGVGPLEAVGITTQRASVVAWDRRTGRPLAPGIGWQDLRTVGECITARAEHGWALAPNQSITKIGWLLANAPGLDDADVCVGTVDSWIAWTLSNGTLHVSDQTNSSATMTGLRHVDGTAWNADRCAAFGIPVSALPAVVDSSGVCGTAHALPGDPPIAALLGDQQASLVGQGCVVPGRAKITFGTGGMLDLCTDLPTPDSAARNPAGTYPLPLWSRERHLTWGVEGIMLSAGSNVEWLRDDLELIDDAAESADVARSVESTDGVVFVPALLGLGTPQWDYGARGTLLGVTRGTGRAHVVRAVLDGVAHRGADLVEAAEADAGLAVGTLRIDGGMSRNDVFVQCLADASGRPVEVCPVPEATTLGAAFMAGLAIGVWSEMDDADRLWQPAAVVEPSAGHDRAAARHTWSRALERAANWHPELSALEM